MMDLSMDTTSSTTTTTKTKVHNNNPFYKPSSNNLPTLTKTKPKGPKLGAYRNPSVTLSNTTGNTLSVPATPKMFSTGISLNERVKEMGAGVAALKKKQLLERLRLQSHLGFGGAGSGMNPLGMGSGLTNLESELLFDRADDIEHLQVIERMKIKKQQAEIFAMQERMAEQMIQSTLAGYGLLGGGLGFGLGSTMFGGGGGLLGTQNGLASASAALRLAKQPMDHFTKNGRSNLRRDNCFRKATDGRIDKGFFRGKRGPRRCNLGVSPLKRLGMTGEIGKHNFSNKVNNKKGGLEVTGGKWKRDVRSKEELDDELDNYMAEAKLKAESEMEVAPPTATTGYGIPGGDELLDEDD